MATASDIRLRVRQYAYGSSPKDRPLETTLNEPLDTSETDIDVLDGTFWALGDIGEIVETGEQFYVLSVATNTLTVIRGYGAVAGTAATTGGRIRKNPRFTEDQIDNAIKDTLNACAIWGIHGFNTGAITLVASQYYYELSDTDIEDAYGVIAAYYVDDTTEQPVPLPYTQHTRLSTTPAEWATDTGITLLSKGDRATGDSVYYTYAQSYSYDTDLDTTLAKIAPEQEEIVVDGAVSRLFGYSILPATQDPGVRTDRTVQPGQTSRDGRWFQGEFFMKARAEAARLSVVRGKIGAGHVRTNRARRWRA